MKISFQWVAFNTIVAKEVRRFVRIWPQTLLPPAITMTLYFVIFGNLIGSRIGDMGGFDYMQFIVPGLVMMSVIQNSYGNVVSSFYSTKFQRSSSGILSSLFRHSIRTGTAGLRASLPLESCNSTSLKRTSETASGSLPLSVFASASVKP